MSQKPTTPFIFVSWVAAMVGIVGYLVGLWNAEMLASEKGYYFTVLMFGLFGAVSVQKSVRDSMEGVPVSGLYYGISWFATLLAIALLIIGLWNATLLLSEKGFYGMAFALSLFVAIVVQKNTRDLQAFDKQKSETSSVDAILTTGDGDRVGRPTE